MPFHVWLPEAHPAAPVARLGGDVRRHDQDRHLRAAPRAAAACRPPPAWWGWLLVAHRRRLRRRRRPLRSRPARPQAPARLPQRREHRHHRARPRGRAARGPARGLAAGRAARVRRRPAPRAQPRAVQGPALPRGRVRWCTRPARRDLDQLGGLGKRMPWTGATFLVGAAAISGLPPLNGFVSEFLIYTGAFAAGRGRSRAPCSPPPSLVRRRAGPHRRARRWPASPRRSASSSWASLAGRARRRAHEVAAAMRLPMAALAAPAPRSALPARGSSPGCRALSPRWRRPSACRRPTRRFRRSGARSPGSRWAALALLAAVAARGPRPPLGCCAGARSRRGRRGTAATPPRRRGCSTRPRRLPSRWWTCSGRCCAPKLPARRRRACSLRPHRFASATPDPAGPAPLPPRVRWRRCDLRALALAPAGPHPALPALPRRHPARPPALEGQVGVDAAPAPALRCSRLRSRRCSAA